MNKIFIVYATHFNNNRGYVVGAFLKKAKALEAAKKEYEYRGSGKYALDVYHIEINKYMDSAFDAYGSILHLPSTFESSHPDGKHFIPTWKQI